LFEDMNAMNVWKNEQYSFIDLMEKLRYTFSIKEYF